MLSQIMADNNVRCKHGRPIVLRHAHFGGGAFWGCKSWPECKETQRTAQEVEVRVIDVPSATAAEAGKVEQMVNTAIQQAPEGPGASAGARQSSPGGAGADRGRPVKELFAAAIAGAERQYEQRIEELEHDLAESRKLNNQLSIALGKAIGYFIAHLQDQGLSRDEIDRITHRILDLKAAPG